MTPKLHSLLLCVLCSFVAQSHAAEPAKPKPLLEESFTEPLSADWFWQLGTWTAKDGILRGFESGPRRHGPIKARRLAFTDADIRFEFRLEGKATEPSFHIDGDRERGHLLNFVVGRTECRIITYAKKGESVDLVRDPIAHRNISPDHQIPVDLARDPIVLADREWHPVRIVIKGETITVTFNDRTWTVKHPAAAEPKDSISLGARTGGPEGEKAGAVEFRKLVITCAP